MFFIRDCNGKVVGNPKGYATFKGAKRQQDMRGSPAYRAIWAAYGEKYPNDNAPDGALICSIAP